MNYFGDYEPFKLDEIDSTNEEAKRILSYGKPFKKFVVIAESQICGRGRLNREWVSPKGNLHFSFVIKPEIEVAKYPLLSFVASLAVRDTVEAYLPGGADVKLKWPNDVLVEGKKISGILIENYISGSSGGCVIIGIGVNVNVVPEDVIFPATSMVKNGYLGENLHIFAGDILEKFDLLYKIMTNEGFSDIRARWLDSACRLGEKVQVTVDKEKISGRFVGLGKNCEMQLELDSGSIKLISVGDVSF